MFQGKGELGVELLEFRVRDFGCGVQGWLTPFGIDLIVEGLGRAASGFWSLGIEK